MWQNRHLVTGNDVSKEGQHVERHSPPVPGAGGGLAGAHHGAAFVVVVGGGGAAADDAPPGEFADKAVLALRDASQHHGAAGVDAVEGKHWRKTKTKSIMEPDCLLPAFTTLYLAEGPTTSCCLTRAPSRSSPRRLVSSAGNAAPGWRPGGAPAPRGR